MRLRSTLEGLHATFDLIIPRAWRPVDARVPAVEHGSGYSWYFSYAPESPEPATFGDCLWELEQLLYDTLEERPAHDLFLLGYRQGAVLALALAAVTAQYLAGAVAIEGYLPAIRDCSLVDDDLDGLPVLLVNDRSAACVSCVSASALAYTRETLTSHNAALTMVDVGRGDGDKGGGAAGCVGRIRAWLETTTVNRGWRQKRGFSASNRGT